jgi:ribosome-associated protein
MAESKYQDIETWRSSTILKEVKFKASLSGGKGGQNVNKVSTKVELYWSPGTSSVLSEYKKVKIISKLSPILSKDVELRLVSEEERSQLRNKQNVIEKFYKLLASCFKVKKIRRLTKPTKGSKERRLDGKSLKKEIKNNRRKPDF